MKKGYRNDTGAVLLVLSAVMCALLIALSVKNFLNIRKVNDNIRLETIALKDNEEKLEFLKTLQNLQPELEYTLAVLKKKIPSNPEEYKIIEHLEKYSWANSSDFMGIQFDEYTKDSEINAIPVKLTFMGSFNNLINLLKEIKTGERLFRFDSIKINKTEDSQIRADLDGYVFYN